jgi:hypothetical protein
MATGNPAIDSNLNNHQRSRVTAAEMERYNVYNGSIHIAHVHANERRHDLLVEAAHARRVNEAVATNRAGRPIGAIVRSASNLRHTIGVALVRVGHRLQHSAAQPATDSHAPLGTLRTAR